MFIYNVHFTVSYLVQEHNRKDCLLQVFRLPVMSTMSDILVEYIRLIIM